MRILLANPRGFCAGVDRAIDIVERAIAMFGAPIYVRHEVVHNVHVVERLRKLGAVFVDELDQVPDGATVIFSAHGVPAAVENEAARRGLTVFDATCPLVTKVHMEVARYAREGRDVVLIGHAGHPEVEGTMGRFDTGHGGRMHLIENVEQARKLEVREPEKLAFVTQTTLSVDDTAAIVNTLRARFPALASPRREDICYATQNRQDAVKELIESCDVLLVVGSITSSNSNRLRELAERAGRPGYLIDDASFLKREWFEGKNSVGVTAGASAPEELVQDVIARLREWGGTAAEELKGREEHVVFRCHAHSGRRSSPASRSGDRSDAALLLHGVCHSPDARYTRRGRRSRRMAGHRLFPVDPGAVVADIDRRLRSRFLPPGNRNLVGSWRRHSGGDRALLGSRAPATLCALCGSV